MTTRFAIAVALLCCACATSSSSMFTPTSSGAGGGTALPTDADDRMVQECQFVGNVVGVGEQALATMKNRIFEARTEARQSAALLGGTHVVWLADGVYGINSSYAMSHARAYRCAK